MSSDNFVLLDTVGQELERMRQTLTELNSTVTNKLDITLSSMTRTRVYEQGFEGGVTDTTTNNATQTVQSSEVYAGSYALRVTISAGQTGYVETPTRPVSPGQQVTFSFAHKEDANIADVKLIVVWYRQNMMVLTTEEFTLTPSTSWTLDSRTLTAPKNAEYMSLRMQATASSSADGNIYLDDMVMDLVGQIFRVDGSGRLMVTDEDVTDILNTYLPNMNVALSTRASEATLSGIKTQTDKLNFDASNYLYINIGADSVGLLKEGGNVNVSNFPSDYPDSGTHSRLDTINNTLQTELTRITKLVGYDYTNTTWRNVAVDSSGRLLATLH